MKRSSVLRKCILFQLPGHTHFAEIIKIIPPHFAERECVKRKWKATHPLANRKPSYLFHSCYSMAVLSQLILRSRGEPEFPLIGKRVARNLCWGSPYKKKNEFIFAVDWLETNELSGWTQSMLAEHKGLSFCWRRIVHVQVPYKKEILKLMLLDKKYTVKNYG